MFKFQFECSDEDRVRADFNNMILRDTPCGKSIFGNDLLRRGIHFTECENSIKGFYIDESENKGTRGSPLRVSFRGRFVKKANKTFFEVYIYPRFFELIFILIAYVSISVAAELIGFLLATVIFIVFMAGYIKGIKETAEIFKRLIS